MNKIKKTAIAALACTMVLGCGGAVIAGCGGGGGGNNPVTVHDDILNGGFEEGDFTGWKAGGDYAFDEEGVVDTDNVEGLDITVGGKVGSYYFNGLAAANATASGTLTSDPFKLGGTGKIGFKMGAGSAQDKCYVEFIEYGTDTVLKKVSNEAYDEGFIDDDLVRVVVDLSEHVGKEIYIKVTDNGTTQKSHEYLHLDDFVVYKTDAEVTAAEAERNDYVKKYGRPVFENDTPTAKTVKNGNFEDGLNNWQVVDGDAYTPRSISPSTLKFWDTREHNAEGDYFLNGFEAGEDKIGAIRSTTFTLAGDGIISFLLSGAHHKDIYVAVCADEAIGDIAKDTELFKVEAIESFIDNSLSQNMLRRYINASTYTPAATEDNAEPQAVSLIGKKLYIKLVDNFSGGDFGAVNFDDVRCSMTEEETIALETADYTWAMGLTGRGADEIKATQDYYTNYNYPVALPVMRFTKTAGGVALKESKTPVDVTAFIDGVEASYGEATNFEYAVTNINYKGSDITSGFNSVVFDTAGIATVTYRAKSGDVTLDATFMIEVTDEYHISNGGFETGNLSGWTPEGVAKPDSAVIASDLYWTTHPYNQGGNYHFDGWAATDNEGDMYYLRSTTFKLGGSGYISFKIGGRTAKVCVYDATSKVCLAEYDNSAYYTWPDQGLNTEHGMMLTYFADLSAFKDMELYVELHDAGSSDWGVAFFDDINTYYETAPTADNTDTVAYEGQNYTLNWVAATNKITPELVQVLNAPKNIFVKGAQTAYDLATVINGIEGAVIGQTNPTITKEVVSVVNGDTTISTGFNALNLAAGDYTVTYKFTCGEDSTVKTLVLHVVNENNIFNGGFETGTLEGWTVVSGNIDLNGGTSNEVHNDWVETLPYNKSGEYFCKNAGLGEHAAWELKSSTFTLGGNGYISFKMASQNAVIKVFKANGEQIYQYTCHTFKDEGFPHVENGGNWCTLRTHYADLSQYIGQELYITIGCSPANAGWEFGHFDDIVTYYADGEDLSTKKDTVLLTCGGNVNAHEANETTEMDWIEAKNEYSAE